MYPYNGFVLYIDSAACVDATTYQGVSYTISLTGTCPAAFLFDDSEHTTSAQDPYHGTCTAASCYGAQFAITPTTTPVTVNQPFGAVPTSLGSPSTPVDPKHLVGVDWEFNATGTSACTGSLTIDNIKFY